MALKLSQHESLKKVSTAKVQFFSFLIIFYFSSLNITMFYGVGYVLIWYNACHRVLGECIIREY